jgi:hypothetical protein
MTTDHHTKRVQEDPAPEVLTKKNKSHCHFPRRDLPHLQNPRRTKILPTSKQATHSPWQTIPKLLMHNVKRLHNVQTRLHSEYKKQAPAKLGFSSTGYECTNDTPRVTFQFMLPQKWRRRRACIVENMPLIMLAINNY